MKKSNSELNDGHLDVVFVPSGWIEIEKEAARLKDHQDLENGYISEAALKRKNGIDWGSDVKVHFSHLDSFGW